jgi:hypothetical protein
MIYLTTFLVAQYIWLNDLGLLSVNVYSISIGRSSKLLPVVVSTVILPAKSYGTHSDQIILSQPYENRAFYVLVWLELLLRLPWMTGW